MRNDRMGFLRMKRAASVLLAVSCLLGLAMQCAAQKPSPAQQNDQLTSLLIKLKTGITLNYVVQGDPKGPVIVLLHGAGDSWHSFDRVFPLLPSRFRVYAVTMRGHGLSDHPETGFSREDFAADIFAFMDQLHLEHVTLAGHSLGSMVAQKVAEEDTGHLDRLVLISSGPPRKRVGNANSATSEFAGMKDPVPYTLARDFQSETIYGPVPAWFYEKLVDEAELVPAATWRGLGSALNSNDTVDDLKKIHVPTLIVWGDKDVYFKKDDEDVLVKTIPNAKFKLYAETGHALHWEQPERFTKDMLDFIATSK